MKTLGRKSPKGAEVTPAIFTKKSMSVVLDDYELMAPGDFQDLQIPNYIGDLQGGETGLLRAKEFAGTAR